jgi:hypothetical protein
MANFKTHLSVGISLGVICAVSSVIFGILFQWTILSLLIISVSVGSFLPDIDSDSSTPFKIVFSTLGIIFAFFTLAWSLQYHSNQLMLVIFTPLFTFSIIRFIIGTIFKKFTHHRGIFHSIPMAIISILITVLLLKNFSQLPTLEYTALSLAIGAGFISHLILDEIYAAINFNGKKFHPNKNLGSALKLWSSSFPITLLVYVIIFILWFFV